MNFFKVSRISIVILMFSTFGFACSHSENPSTPKGALPESWVNLRENQNNRSTEILVMPDPETDSAVQSAFQANVSALTQADTAHAAIPSQSTNAVVHPSDWTPWHLDGMVGYYAISQGGILGALLYSGTESIKLTWQKVSPPVSTTVSTTVSSTVGSTGASTPAALAPAAPGATIVTSPIATPIATPIASVGAQKTPALKVTPSMTASDLGAALEPSIEVALASGRIQDESAFRKNLLTHAQRFFSVTQVLASIPRASEWYVDGYQLNLSVSASGQVTPVIGVGGAVNLYFDWSRVSDPTVAPGSAPSTSAAANAMTPDASLLSNELKNFVSLMSSEIPRAITESMRVQQNGFYLDMIQVGLGVTAGGTIGVAQGSGGDIGRVIFKRDVNVTPAPAATSVTLANPVADADSDQQLNVMPALVASAPAGFSYKVSAFKVRNSLKKAISMAAYFAARAKKAETTRYHLNQIEAEFDMSLGGDLKLAVVNGIGQFVLDFDWIKKN